MWSAFTRAPAPATASLRSPKVADNNNSSAHSTATATTATTTKSHLSKTTTVSSSLSSTLPNHQQGVSTTPQTPKTQNTSNQYPHNSHDVATDERNQTQKQLDEEDESHVARLMENFAYACSPPTSPCKGVSDTAREGNVEVLLASLGRQFQRHNETNNSHDHDDNDDDFRIKDLQEIDTQEEQADDDHVPHDLVGRIGDFVSESLASMLEQTQLTIDEADRQLTQDEGDTYEDGCYYDAYNQDDASTVHPDLATTHFEATPPPRYPSSSQQQHMDPAMWTMNSPLAHTPAVMMVEDEEDLQLKEQLLSRFSKSEAFDEPQHLPPYQEGDDNDPAPNNTSHESHEDNDDDTHTTMEDHQTRLLARGWVLSPVSSDLTPATMNRAPDPPASHIVHQRAETAQQEQNVLLDHVQESTSEQYEDNDYDDDDESETETQVEYNESQDEEVVSTEEGPGYKKIMYHIVNKDGHEQTVVIEEDYEGEEAVLTGTEDEHQHEDEIEYAIDDEEIETHDDRGKETDDDDDYTTNTYYPFISGDTSVGMTTAATPTVPLLQHQDKGAFSSPPVSSSHAATTSPEAEEEGELSYISATDLTDVETDLHNGKFDRYTTVRELSNNDNVTSSINAGQLLSNETEEDNGRALTTTESSASEADLHITDSLDSWLNQMKSKSYTTDDEESSRDSPRKKAAVAHDNGDATPIPEESGEDDDVDDPKSSRPRSRSDTTSFRATKSFATYATNRSTIARSVKTVSNLKASQSLVKEPTSTIRPCVASSSATTKTSSKSSSAIAKKQWAPISGRISTAGAARSVTSNLPHQTPKATIVTSTAGIRSTHTRLYPGGVAPINVLHKTMRPTAKPETNVLPRRPRTVTIEVSNRLLVGTAASRAQKIAAKETTDAKQPTDSRLTPASAVKTKAPVVRKSNVCGVGANTSRLLQQQAAARGEIYRPPTPTLAPTASTDSSQRNLRVRTAPVSSRLLRPTAASLAQRIRSDSVSPTASSVSRGTMSSMDSYGFGVRKHAPHTAVVKSSVMPRMADAAPPRPNSRPKPRVITTPKSPFFATNAKYGSGTSSSNSHKPRPDAPTLAQSHDVLQKCLRDISPSDSSARSHTLTVPKSPNLHTSSRLRDKKVLDLTHLLSHGGSKDQDDIPMANSTDFLMRGLRDGAPAVSVPVKRDGKLTIPVTPKFHTIHKRATVKSHDESNDEIMEYNNSHPFKALKMPSSSAATCSSHPYHANPVPNRPHRPTEPIPFHFHTAERHRTPKPGEPNNQRASSNSRARPTPEAPRPRTVQPIAPNLATSARSASREAAREASERRAEELMREKQQLAAKRQRERHLEEMAKAAASLSHVTTTTSVQPFTFQSDRPKNGESAREASERRAEELRREKQRLAAKRVRERHLETTSLASSMAPPKTTVQPFTFHTNRPSSSYQTLKEASERRAEALMREKQLSAAKRAKEKHLEEMRALPVSASPLKTIVEPFSLQTDQRHAKYEKLFLETKRRQEVEEDRLAKFRARPCPETTFRESTVATHHAHRPATTPEPFHLRSVSRHEAYQQEHQKKIKEEEEKMEQEEVRMMISYKALPVPKSTYVSPPPPHHGRSAKDSPESFQWESLPPDDEQEEATLESSEYGIAVTSITIPNNKARSTTYASPPMPGGCGASIIRSNQRSQCESSSMEPTDASDPYMQSTQMDE